MERKGPTWISFPFFMTIEVAFVTGFIKIYSGSGLRQQYVGIYEKYTLIITDKLPV